MKRQSLKVNRIIFLLLLIVLQPVWADLQSESYLLEVNKYQSINKTAVILIPGLNGWRQGRKRLYEWRNFVTHWQRSGPHPEHKLYIYNYYGWGSVYNAAEKLSGLLSGLSSQELEVEEFILVGYSQGGLIARIIDAEKSQLSEKIRKVITLGASHNGAALTTPEISENMLEGMGLLGRLYGPFYWRMRRHYRYAYQEQAWQQVDLPMSNDYSKYILYGAYMTRELAPRWSVRHHAQNLLSKLLRKEACQLGSGDIGLSDGLVQLSSALWLQQCEIDEEFVNIFPSELNYCLRSQSRIFQNINHLNYRNPPKRALLDRAHSEEPARHLYDWLIKDIMD